MATHELKNETTLASIAEAPSDNPHYLLFAVIVDITETAKFAENENFVTRLKIIDPTFNYKATLKGTDIKFFKFATVTIYSETPESAPRIQYIGDIIRLRRFKFGISEDRGELYGTEVKFSNWLIYSGEKGSEFTDICHKSIYESKNHDRFVNQIEQGRITDLREWSAKFFAKHSLRYIIWWNDYVSHNTDKKGQKAAKDAKNVDLVVKVLEAKPKEKVLRLIDAEDNVFIANLETQPKVRKDDIIKLRCVDVQVEVSKKEENRMLQFTSRSSCLYLRPHFRDAVAFAVDKKKYPNKSYYLMEFAERTKNYATVVKKTWEKVKPTPIHKLQQYLVNEPEAHVNDKFVVEGYIRGFASLDPNHIIMKQVLRNRPVVSIKDNSHKKFQIIYHINPKISDDSKEQLEFHIITNEENYYMFDAWKILPQTKDVNGWNEIKPAKYTQFTDKLKQLSDKQIKTKFVLQLLMTESRKPFLKVIDTMFVDF